MVSPTTKPTNRTSRESTSLGGELAFQATSALAPEMELIRRAMKKDPSVRMVNPGSFADVQVPAGQNFSLFTWALAGCTSVALVGKDPEGNCKAFMTHYDGTDCWKHLSVVRAACKDIGADVKLGDVSAIIVARGRGLPHIEPVEVSPTIIGFVEEIESVVNAELGKKRLTLLSLPYENEPCERYQFSGKGGGSIIHWVSENPGNPLYDIHAEHFGLVFPYPSGVSSISAQT